jgi:hypothetical protein
MFPGTEQWCVEERVSGFVVLLGEAGYVLWRPALLGEAVPGVLGRPILVGLDASHGGAPFGVMIYFPGSVEWFCAESRHWV